MPADAYRMGISADTLPQKKSKPLILADRFEKVICRVSAKLLHPRRVILSGFAAMSRAAPITAPLRL
jgi:hypothetical protein